MAVPLKSSSEKKGDGRGIVRFGMVSSLALLTLAACGLTSEQKNAVSKFGKSTSGFGETTGVLFQDARKTVIRQNEIDRAIRGMKPTTETLDGSGNFATKSILPAKRAALALEEYGKLLEAIVAESQEEQLKTAASKFSSSIKNIPADYGGGAIQRCGEYFDASSIRESDPWRRRASATKHFWRSSTPIRIYATE